MDIFPLSLLKKSRRRTSSWAAPTARSPTVSRWTLRLGKPGSPLDQKWMFSTERCPQRLVMGKGNLPYSLDRSKGLRWKSSFSRDGGQEPCGRKGCSALVDENHPRNACLKFCFLMRLLI